MFLADEDVTDLYTKKSHIIDNINKNDYIGPPKKPVCRFFIPKVNVISSDLINNVVKTASIEKTINLGIESNVELFEDDSLHNSVYSGRNGDHLYIDESRQSNLRSGVNETLSLISNPLPVKYQLVENIKKENILNVPEKSPLKSPMVLSPISLTVPSPNVPTVLSPKSLTVPSPKVPTGPFPKPFPTFSPLNVQHNEKMVPQTSENDDSHHLTINNPENAEVSTPINNVNSLPMPTLIPIKREPCVPRSSKVRPVRTRLMSRSPSLSSNSRSSSATIQTLHVDMDKDISRADQPLQSEVISDDQTRSEKLNKKNLPEPDDNFSPKLEINSNDQIRSGKFRKRNLPGSDDNLSSMSVIKPDDRPVSKKVRKGNLPGPDDNLSSRSEIPSDDRTGSEKYRKRKIPEPDEDLSSNSLDEDSKRTKKFQADKRKPVKRIVETDEETEPAFMEKKRKMSSAPKRSTESDIRSKESDNGLWNITTDNQSIYCFKCKMDNATFCFKHPVTKILNINIDCPYIEYLLDESYDRYFDKSRAIEDCTCQQNELDHIQQSLPGQFQLRESELFEIGVWTKVAIAQSTIIGPYLGQIIENYKAEALTINRYNTRGTSKSSYFSPCIEFAFKSNWLRCISFTNDRYKANCQVLHYDNKVFFQATKNLSPDEELLVINENLFSVKVETKFAKDIPQREEQSARSSHSSVSLPEGLDYTICSDEELRKIPFKGTKYNREMIIDIARVWRAHPQITIGETLKIIGEKHPTAQTISERYLSRLTRKYRLRHKGGANVKFDSQMREFVRMLLLKDPEMSPKNINKMLKERFPLRVSLNHKYLENIIDLDRLRPSEETCRFMNTIMSEGIDFDDKKAVNKDVFQLEQKTEESVVKRIQNDADLVEAIREIVFQEPLKHADQILTDLKRKFPENKMLNIHSVKSLMKKNNIVLNLRHVKKIDDEMKRFICKLRKENPHYSAAKINQFLRQAMPGKPFVEPNAIYLVLRKFNIMDRK